MKNLETPVKTGRVGRYVYYIMIIIGFISFNLIKIHVSYMFRFNIIKTSYMYKIHAMCNHSTSSPDKD